MPIFQDHFLDNRNEWEVRDDANALPRTGPGDYAYVMQRRRKQGEWTTWQPFFIDDEWAYKIHEVQKLRQSRGLTQMPLSLHMVLAGPPGTGKTTVARLTSRRNFWRIRPHLYPNQHYLPLEQWPMFTACSVYLAVQEVEPGDANGIGKVISLYTKGWLPYTLRWQFRITENRSPHGFSLEAWGDFVGTGDWTFTQDGDWVNITYDWRIRADKPLLRYLSFIMKPIFSANHHWAMRQGEESLRRELARRHKKTATAA